MKQSSRRFLSFVIAVVLLLAALVIFSSLIRPTYNEAQATKGELLSRETLLANQRSAVDQIRSLIEAYRGEGDFAEVVELSLPKEKNEAEIVHQITQLALGNGLTIQNIALSASGSENISSSNDVFRGETAGDLSQPIVRPVGTVQVQVRLSGSYLDFRNFLNNIETNIRIMDPKNISVTPAGTSGQDFYLFDVALFTYYQTQ